MQLKMLRILMPILLLYACHNRSMFLLIKPGMDTNRVKLLVGNPQTKHPMLFGITNWIYVDDSVKHTVLIQKDSVVKVTAEPAKSNEYNSNGEEVDSIKAKQ